MSVKKKKRGRPSVGSDKLTADSIIATAREQMLQHGQKLSIRGLARELNVDPMAIYYYFENKNALLEAVATNIMDDIYTPDRNKPWEEELEKLCSSYLALLRDHPGLLETLLAMASSGLRHGDVFQTRFEIAVDAIGLAPETKNVALDLLVDYLHGFALAIHLSKDANKVNISDMQKPFALYLRALRYSLANT